MSIHSATELCLQLWFQTVISITSKTCTTEFVLKVSQLINHLGKEVKHLFVTEPEKTKPGSMVSVRIKDLAAVNITGFTTVTEVGRSVMS